MYRCDGCGHSSAPREPMNKVTNGTRQVEYYTIILRHKRNDERVVVYHKLSNDELEAFKKDNFDVYSEKSSKGWEIISEHKLCKKCYQKRQNESTNNGQ